MVKRALLVGCNYPGEACELKGSTNDIDRMRILLIKRFGFNHNEILELVDADPRSRQPTGANIRKCLWKLVDDVEPGDVLFFHFSGHGCQVPSELGRPDETGYEESIVPSDMNILTDDDFRDLVDRIPRGVNFTFIADACHSGGLIDSEKEQIGDQYSGGGGRPLGRRPRPPGAGRPAAGGGGGLMDEGAGAYASSPGGGRNSNPGLNAVGQGLGSRFNRLPGDDRNREFDPQEIDAYARQPESPYDRRYGEGGVPERSYERRDPRELETGSYEDGGSGYPAGYERREGRGSDRPHAGSGYTKKFMKRTPMIPATGYADVSLGYNSDYMQSGNSVPEIGYADRGLRPYDRPGSPYTGGYAPEASFGRPVGDDYGYPARGPIPGDDEFGFPPRGAFERPVRPVDDDLVYPARPVRPTGDEYGFSAHPGRPVDDDYLFPSEGASRRSERGGYGHASEDSYRRAPDERHGGDRRQGYDSREDDRRGRHGEASSYEETSRYPTKYASEFSASGGSYGGDREPGERYGDHSYSGDHGYSGKPHHTPLKNKSLPIEVLTDILSHRTGQNVRPGNIHRTLYDMFGDDASRTVKLIVNILLNKSEDSGERGGQTMMGKIGEMASSLLKTNLVPGAGSLPSGGPGAYGDYPEDRPSSPVEEFQRSRRPRRRNYDAGILISACESDETSADANPTNNHRDAYGALSNAIQTIIGESRAPLTNRQVVMASRKLLSQQGYRQHPCLYCSDRNADALFLTPM